MFTLRQIEAFYWAVELGGFGPASARLNASQSAISKRLQELESALGAQLWDRSARKARLTAKGEEILPLARDLLALTHRILDATAHPGVAPLHLRIGVTDLTATTWLPAWVQRIRAAHPRVVIAPEVDTSARLVSRLRSGKLDLVICPDAFRTPDLDVVMLESVRYAWMCSPDYLDGVDELSLKDIARRTVIVQTHESGLGNLIGQWLADHGISIDSAITSSNLTALEALTLSGLGISYLPREAFRHLVSAGRLNIIRSKPSLPRIQYVAMARTASDDKFLRFVKKAALESCDFSKKQPAGL